MSKCLYCQTELPEGYGMVCSTCEKSLTPSGDFEINIHPRKRKSLFKRCSNCTHLDEKVKENQNLKTENTQLKYELGKAREKLDKIGLLADIAISIMK